VGSSPRGGPRARMWSPRMAAPSGSLVAALTSALVSCGGPGPDVPTPTPLIRQTPPASPDVAVLSAYRAEQAAFITAIGTADASYPGLAQTMVDPLLSEIRKQLIADRGNGIVGKGRVDLNPRVDWIRGAEAQVVDCAFDQSQLVYVSNGQPVPPVKPPHAVSITATLVETAGAWKVSTQTVSEAPCSTAS